MELRPDGAAALPYVTKKVAGFYTDNIDFKNKDGLIEAAFETVTYELIYSIREKGVVPKKNVLITKYLYHYFEPIFLSNIEQESIIALPQKLPAFYLKINAEAAFWSNVMTTVEYAFDILTTASGVGNKAEPGFYLPGFCSAI